MIADPATPAPLSKAELVAYLGEEMADGSTPAEAAREADANLTFDEDLERELRVWGLNRLAHWVKDATNGPSHTPKVLQFQRRGMTPPERRDVLNRVMLVGADGVTKRLLDFTLADCVRSRETAGAESAGWQKKEEAMGIAVGLLNLHKVDKIGSLPAKALSTLRGSMTELWR